MSVLSGCVSFPHSYDSDESLRMCAFDLQTTEISAFSRALREHCAQREMGADRRGSSKGSQNAKLVDAMEDVRTVADLQELRRSRSSGVLRSVDVAIRRLVARHIIPEGVPPATLKLAYDTIHATNEGLTNQELFKELCNATKSKPELQAYTALVTRLWLISPAESVVESMASIVKEVFGVHRQLLHENAAKELIVRWNGPDMCSADGFIREVQRRHKFNFMRSSLTIAATAEGTVIARHKTKRCPRASFFNS